MNKLNSFLGSTPNTAFDATPTWTNNDVGVSTDSVKQRADLLTQKFNDTLGHAHDGTPGNGAPVSSNNIANVPYRAYGQQATDLTAVTGVDVDVSTELTGKTPSTSSAVLGVVVNNPENRIIIRQASGTNEGDEYLDGLGNVVYGRLTESVGVWTLSFYTFVAGVETAYSFTANDIRWYYQEIFNPLSTTNPPPVYDSNFVIPSDNVTADVVDASTTQRGVVNTIAQSFAGDKTFTEDVNIDGTTRLATSLSGPLRAASGVVSTGNTDLASEVTGVLPIANGGTNGSTQTTGFNNLSPLTTKGDLIVHDGTNNVRQAVGTDGQTLVADSTQSTGVKWGVGIIYRAGSASLSMGDSSKTVTFSSSLPSANYQVNVIMFNDTDAEVQYQPITITDKTTNGFTAKWNAGTDSANYFLNYSAIGDL